MRVVARTDARDVLRERGEVYVWARAIRYCNGRQYLLETSLERPPGEFELAHAADGFQVWTTPRLIQPDELHFELDRRGRVQAYWNGQGWVG